MKPLPVSPEVAEALRRLRGRTKADLEPMVCAGCRETFPRADTTDGRCWDCWRGSVRAEADAAMPGRAPTVRIERETAPVGLVAVTEKGRTCMACGKLMPLGDRHEACERGRPLNGDGRSG